ncbi:MAG: hypothetical protein ABW277_23330 [Longimicrobiaceae bacterium]
MVATKAPAQGSSLRHLAMILFGNRDLARCDLAFFTAYFDASGHPADSNLGASLFFSGFVSTAEKWLRFEKAWLALLADNGIEPPFHMADFEAGEGQYARWRGDFAGRQVFLHKAAAVIRRHTRKPFSHGIVIADLQRMYDTYEFPENERREAFPWCGVLVLGKVLAWARKGVRQGNMRGDDTIEFVFEDGDKHRGQFMDLAEETYKILPIPRKKNQHLQFDACDLLAWEHRRFLGQLVRRDTKHPPRSSLVEIMRLFPGGAFTFQHWGLLDAACKARGLKQR